MKPVVISVALLWLAGWVGTVGGAAADGPDGHAASPGVVEYGTFRSESLGRDVPYAVSLPPSYAASPERRYPLVIFLHGMFNDERDWETRGVQAALDALREKGRVGEFIVAIPRGENSFYINAKQGDRYEDAIVRDFLPFIERRYRTLGVREGRMIAGISMGGYGALLIAFKHPTLFAGVAAHCAAIFTEPPRPPQSAEDRIGAWRYSLATKLYGDPPDAAFFEAHSPLAIARAQADAIRRLKIYFDVGTEDRYRFDVGNQRLHETLEALNIPHEFTLAPGGHGWAFLTARSEPAFTFCWRTLSPAVSGRSAQRPEKRL
ncbi:MAG: esterase family protein [Chloracidobacterium sp.]|nr:esterase family protein [Chloracidobacterium sp.]MDW8218074.1 alpha/beta hydrolase-fold protein [Acidobacteriota bacterium]